jgi:hypothetical protein
MLPLFSGQLFFFRRGIFPLWEVFRLLAIRTGWFWLSECTLKTPLGEQICIHRAGAQRRAFFSARMI